MPTEPSSAHASPVATVDWGRTRYADAWKRQEELVAKRLSGAAPDTLVFTEHEAVYTIGIRSGSAKNLVWSPEELQRRGIEVSETNRGGDITYHGPGQIVGYPIVDLNPRKDLHAYLRFLEQIMINTAARYGLKADRRPGMTGIWIERRKLAAIGVAVRRWITYHGFAMNISTRLGDFEGIIPCGISASDGTVTSLEAELGRAVPLNDVKAILSAEFRTLWPEFIAGGSPDEAGTPPDTRDFGCCQRPS